MKSLVHALFVFAILAGASSALASGALPDGPYIIASGKATTDVAPDYAVFQFSVQGLAPTTEAATAIIGTKAAKIFAVLKKAGVSDDDVRASSVNVSPRYEYVNDKRVNEGQEAKRSFKVTLHDLKNFSSLIQGLLNTDLDEMDDVKFGSSKEDEIEKTNMEAAIDDARKHANDMAERVGEHVDRVYGMAPGQFSNYIGNDFPYEFSGSAERGQLGKIEVVGTDIAAANREQGYFIPKSITFSSSVTIVCTVKQ